MRLAAVRSVAVQALDGHGILLRSQQDAAQRLRTGRLVPTDWDASPAQIYAVFQATRGLQAKTRVQVDLPHESMWMRRKSGRGALRPW